MLPFWPKKKTAAPADVSWEAAAEQALNQAVAAAPVPALLRNKAKHEFRQAAEAVTRAAGRSRVTTEDLMAGMLAKMPAGLRGQVEAALKGGPEALEKLQKKFTQHG